MLWRNPGSGLRAVRDQVENPASVDVRVRLMRTLPWEGCTPAISPEQDTSSDRERKGEVEGASKAV